MSRDSRVVPAGKWQFLPYIERGITNFVRVDVCNVGGFTEACKVAGWAEAHYIDLMPHNPLGPISTAACIHLAAASANFAWLEDRSTESGFQWVHGRPFTKYPQRAGLTPGPPPASAASASALRLL